MPTKIIQRFLHLESLSGLLLLGSAVFAIIIVNSPLAFIHRQFIQASIFFINEGLMAFFFLIVGLELKRNFIEGTFSSPSQIMLPFVSSIGGMVIPILIYVLINWHDSSALRGWATPSATDIAFALGVLTLFRAQVPINLKLFLLTVAIFDDLGAILIIAIFFSHGFSLVSLVQSFMLLFLLYLLNRFSFISLTVYLLVGGLLWLTLLNSGIHPTLAGVLLALFIPHVRPKSKSPLYRLEVILHPWVAYLIMPLFAFVNSGINLSKVTMDMLMSGVVLGISLGLFLGKQIGVFGFSFIWIKMKFSRLPDRTTWPMLYGVALLCGIGFTMSLFLGTLSFHNQTTYLAEVRLGVIIGSILSGGLGASVLWYFASRKRVKE